VTLDNVNITGKSVKEAKKENLLFTVYPNPSNGIFNINWQMESEYSYAVTDITGKTIVLSEPTDIKTAQLDLTGVATGMYFLNVTSNGTSVTKKLMVR
jgi:hypothetical protein